MASGLGVAGVCALLTLNMLLVAGVFALAEAGIMRGWVAALLVALVVLLIGTVAGLVGWSRRVREPLPTHAPFGRGEREMGERADGVKGNHGGARSSAIEREISGIRDEIGTLVGELDRRRRDLFDVRGQVRRHPVAASMAGLAVAAVLGGSVALLVHNTRRKHRASYRAKQLRIAFGRMMEHPERVARGEPPPGEKSSPRWGRPSPRCS